MTDTVEREAGRGLLTKKQSREYSGLQVWLSNLNKVKVAFTFYFLHFESVPILSFPCAKRGTPERPMTCRVLYTEQAEVERVSAGCIWILGLELPCVLHVMKSMDR